MAPSLLDDLNPAQRQAVLTTSGPLLVLAGAGSGKTRVLTRRIAYLIGEGGVSPSEVLAITFTNKAAQEMRHRLSEMLGGCARQMWAMTFHSFCVRVLRMDADRLGFSRSFTIYDDDDTRRMLAAVMGELGIDPKTLPVNLVRSKISKAKSEMVGPEGMATAAATPHERSIAKVYARYGARMLEASAMDFDDLLVNAVRLFEEHPAVLAAYRDRFRHVSVDEYQDTNYAQYRICGLLAPGVLLSEGGRSLMVVGDDDQSIYSWRGADIRNILDFEEDHPGAKVIRLEENYRSTATILAAANAVVANNVGRKPKTLFTANAGGEAIARYHATDEHDEARFAAGEIERLLRAERRSYADFVVFYRTHAQSRVVEDVFLRAGVPYRIVGGTRFFDRAEIRDVMAYLRIAANPADEMALKRVINTPKRGIGEATVDKLALEAARAGCTLMQACERARDAEWLDGRARRAVGGFADIVRGIRDLEGSSLRDQVEDVIGGSGLLAALEAERTLESQGRAENVREFLSVVEEFSEAHPEAGLPEFLEWAALRTDLDTLDEGDGSVTLMTLHNAKGLEFPVVFIVGCEDALLPHSSSLFDTDGMEEERRLMYVGITRARERLYLTHARERQLYGQWQRNAPSRFVREIPEEHVVSSGIGSVGYSDAAGRRAWRGESPSSAFTSAIPRGEGRTFGSGAARKPAAGTPEVFEPGQPVEHKVFGRGTVVEVVGDKVSVRFPELGVKNLLAGFAPLRKVAD